MNFKVNLFILSFMVCVNSLSSSMNERICGDILLNDSYWEDHLSELEKLKDCSMIDGSIKLNNITSRDPLTQIDNISFPKLREIRGILSIVGVDKLTSIKYLLPKLMVIRGQTGLQIAKNKDMKEIGLTNIKHIYGVRIIDNPKLCFVDTINWKKISYDFPLLMGNNNSNNCPNCSNSQFCWNEEDSQLICNSSCLSGVCERDGKCCALNCLGGCSSDSNDCEICRNLRFNGTCIDKCPENTFVFKDGSCVTSEECETKNSMLEKNEMKMQVHDGECRNKCSSGFKMIKFGKSNANFICVGSWKKICDGDIFINDTSIYSYSDKRPCMIITGFVEINLSIDFCENENLLETLSKTLSKVVEIHKYLKITATNIRNLWFIPKLERIHGIELESEKFSLILENNKNLKKLWLPGQNVSLDRGETKLEGSPKLCESVDCNDISLEQEIEVFTYAAKIKWNSTKKLPNNLMYAIWKNEEFYQIKQSFCPTKNAKPIKEETPGVHKIYSLETNTDYVYQMFDGNSMESIGSQKYFGTLFPFIGITETSTTSSNITFNWKAMQNPSAVSFRRLNFYQIVRFELKAFRIPPDYEFYKDRNYCNLTTNNSTEDPNEQSENLNIAVINRMRSDIKQLFQRELLHEEISKDSIKNEFFSKEVEGTTYNYTFFNVSHFAEYFVSIKGCYQFEELDCSMQKIFSITTSKDDEVDQIENLSGKVVNSNTIQLKWDSPKQPNGLVLTFSVHFGIVDSEQTKTLCITYHQFKDGGNRKLIEHLTTGKYEFFVVVRSLAGYGRRSDSIFVEIEPSYLMYWIISTLGLILLAFAILLIFQIRRFRSKEIKPENSGVASFINKPDDGFELTHSEDQPLPSSSSQQDDILLKSQMKVCCDFEIERDDIELLNKLGSGQFGLVFEGILKNEDDKLNVAVKTVSNEASLEDSINFLKEAEIMKNFKTFHVIKLLGIVSKSKPYFVVMELMTNGDLKTFLRKNRPQAPPIGNYSSLPLKSTVPLVSHMAIQIADGMAYLSHKKFVHRDLAARNCMVSDDLTVKIGDFGLTRDIYEADYYRKRTDCLLPVRWMSPESLKYGIFTSESDVFSYGIVLWEIVTYAEQPYKGKSNDQVFTFIIEGGSESRPIQICSDRIYEIMTKCWRLLPEERISFIEIIEELLSEAPNTFSDQSFYGLRS